MFRYEIRELRRGDRTIVAKSPVDAESAMALHYEARLLGRIRHPNVIELLAAPDHDDPAMLTEHAGSYDLAEVPPADITAARAAVRSVVATLADLHREGFCHGAVTPEHLVAGPGGRITLCGFRRAREVAAESSAGCTADGRSVATMIRWWLATIPTTRADRHVAEQLAEVADRLESDRPPTMAAVRTMLETPRRPDRATGLTGAVERVASLAARPRSVVSDLALRRRRRPAPGAAPAARPRPAARSADARPPRTRPAWAALSPHVGVLGFHVAAIAALALVAPHARAAAPTASLVVSVIWLAAVAAAALGALSGAVAIAAEWRDLPQWRRFAERASVPWARRAVAGVTAFGVSATAVLSMTARPTPEKVATVDSPSPDPTRRAPGSTSSTSTSTTTSSTTTSTSTTSTTSTTLPPVVVTPLDPGIDHYAVVVADDLVDEDGDGQAMHADLVGNEAPGAPGTSPDDAATQTWTVRPGDHLWGIAESTLSVRLGRPVTDAEIVPYWRQVIEHNRGRLPDPSNPDLILAGAELLLPPL